MKVLVVYASRAGSTKGIAEYIGEKLRNGQTLVDVKEAASAVNVGDYDAFVVGSAVYEWHWVKAAKEFVLRNRFALAGKPVWLFSSGPTGPKLTDSKGRDLRSTSVPKDLEELRRYVNPRDHRVFFGALYPEKLKGAAGFFARAIPQEERGDFRDWNDIGSWVEQISAALAAQQGDRQSGLAPSQLGA